MAQCPELGLSTEAQTKERAKARLVDMVVARLGRSPGGDGSPSPPSTFLDGRLKTLKARHDPPQSQGTLGLAAFRLGGWLPVLALVLLGLAFLWGILSVF